MIQICLIEYRMQWLENITQYFLDFNLQCIYLLSETRRSKEKGRGSAKKEGRGGKSDEAERGGSEETETGGAEEEGAGGDEVSGVLIFTWVLRIWLKKGLPYIDMVPHSEYN